MNKTNKKLSVEPQLTTSLDVFKLIQPNLMTVDELVDVLHERGVDNKLMPQNMDELVSLFKRVAYPLPQREFRRNFRGSLIMKQRKNTDRITFNESSADIVKTYTIGVAENPAISKNNLEVKSYAERLKPPLDLVNFERKKICLSSSTSTSNRNEPSSDLDKIVIKKRKTSESSNNTVHNQDSQEISIIISKIPTKNVKPQKMDSSENGTSSNQECNGTRSKPEPKKVALKRNHLLSKVDSTSDKPAKEPEKKRKPITWP